MEKIIIRMRQTFRMGNMYQKPDLYNHQPGFRNMLLNRFGMLVIRQQIIDFQFLSYMKTVKVLHADISLYLRLETRIDK